MSQDAQQPEPDNRTDDSCPDGDNARPGTPTQDERPQHSDDAVRPHKLQDESPAKFERPNSQCFHH